MELGKIVGQVITTVREDKLPTCSLLLVALCDPAGQPTGMEHVAVDPLGAGEGELVLLSRGSSARQGFSHHTPVDLCIVGIVDEVTGAGNVYYTKAGHRS